jgi:hypothetical protein
MLGRALKPFQRPFIPAPVLVVNLGLDDHTDFRQLI